MSCKKNSTPLTERFLRLIGEFACGMRNVNGEIVNENVVFPKSLVDGDWGNLPPTCVFELGAASEKCNRCAAATKAMSAMLDPRKQCRGYMERKINI